MEINYFKQICWSYGVSSYQVYVELCSNQNNRIILNIFHQCLLMVFEDFVHFSNLVLLILILRIKSKLKKQKNSLSLFNSY